MQYTYNNCPTDARLPRLNQLTMSYASRIFAKHLKPSAIAVLLVAFATSVGQAQDRIVTDPITPDSINADEGQAAQEAADAWLALIDSLDYAASWQQAAPMFQQQTSEAQWVQTLRSTLGPLGPFISRAPQEREYRTVLPGAPEGEYVIVTYGSHYTQLAQAVETVVMAKTDADTWQAAGYLVRPAQ